MDRPRDRPVITGKPRGASAGMASRRVVTGIGLTVFLSGVALAVIWLVFPRASREQPVKVVSLSPATGANSGTGGSDDESRLPNGSTSTREADRGSAGRRDEGGARQAENSPRWSWTAGGNKSDGLTGWEQAFEDATKYVLGNQPRQKEALRLYQRVLDANPPRTLALHVKLTMAARMTILYNPALGEQSHEEEAIRWCQQVLQDYEDWPTHHDVMVAKIYLGDLYCWDRPGREDREKATRLYWDVIEVPEDQIVFDDPEMSNLNMGKIAVAKHPGGGRRIAADGTFITEPTEEMNNEYRKMLLEGRKESVCSLRRAAIRALAYKQGEVGLPAEITRDRLTFFKQRRPNDHFYQETLDKIIKDFVESNESLKSGRDGVLDWLGADETINSIGNQK